MIAKLERQSLPEPMKDARCRRRQAARTRSRKPSTRLLNFPAADAKTLEATQTCSAAAIG
jgi:hypothetical protein